MLSSIVGNIQYIFTSVHFQWMCFSLWLRGRLKGKGTWKFIRASLSHFNPNAKFATHRYMVYYKFLRTSIRPVPLISEIFNISMHNATSMGSDLLLLHHITWQCANFRLYKSQILSVKFWSKVEVSFLVLYLSMNRWHAQAYLELP